MMSTSNVAWLGRYPLPGRAPFAGSHDRPKKIGTSTLAPQSEKSTPMDSPLNSASEDLVKYCTAFRKFFEGIASHIFVNPTARYWSQLLSCAYMQKIGVRVRRLVVSWLLPSCASMSSVLLLRPGTSLRVQNVSRNGSHGSTTDPVDPVGEGMAIVNCPCGPQSPGAGA